MLFSTSYSRRLRGVDDRRRSDLGDLVANAEEVYPAVIGFMVRASLPAVLSAWSQIARWEGRDSRVGTPEAPGLNP
jgi:hypothetical protein